MRDTLDFKLVGSRRYVRATDILRTIEPYAGGNVARIEFIKPLRSHAVLVEAPMGQDVVGGVSVSVELATGKTFMLIPSKQRAQKVCERKKSRFRSIVLRFGCVYIVVAPLGMSALDLMETSFDKVHPRLPRRFLVRRITRFTSLTPRIRALWFRLKVCDDATKFSMRTLGAKIARIECRVVDR